MLIEVVSSNIKPLIYSAALEQGFTLATLVNDAPINQWNPGAGIAWRPKNSPDVYEGPIRLRKALAKSKNVVSVRLIRELGVKTAADHIAKFGLTEASRRAATRPCAPTARRSCSAQAAS